MELSWKHSVLDRKSGNAVKTYFCSSVFLLRLPTVTSPYDDGIPGNPVGSLQELCISHRWAPPSYLLDGENGLPHEREFVITCIVESYQEVGSGKSKKLAKRQAAYRMLMKLKDTPIELPNQGGGLEDEDEVFTDVCSDHSSE